MAPFPCMKILVGQNIACADIAAVCRLYLPFVSTEGPELNQEWHLVLSERLGV